MAYNTHKFKQLSLAHKKNCTPVTMVTAQSGELSVATDTLIKPLSSIIAQESSLFYIVATPAASNGNTGMFNKTEELIRAAITAGKLLIVKYDKNGTLYVYHLFYVKDTTSTLTLGFSRSVEGKESTSDLVMEWYSTSCTYNLQMRLGSGLYWIE